MIVLFFNLTDTVENLKTCSKTAGMLFLSIFMFFLVNNYYFCCLSCHELYATCPVEKTFLTCDSSLLLLSGLELQPLPPVLTSSLDLFLFISCLLFIFKYSLVVYYLFSSINFFRLVLIR